MNIVTGAMGSLIPKLGELLMEEYKLHKRIKKDVEFLRKELESMHAALIKVGEVPRDQLDRQVKLWAEEVRELSYNMEDVVDKFLVRVEGIQQPHDNTSRFKELKSKMLGLFKKGKNHHRIADAVKEIKEQLQEVAARRDRNKVVVPNPTEPIAIDPCLRALYAEATELVGIYGKRDQELMRLLSMEGLGKTTLARAVYDKIKGDFDCQAFVSVGQNPDMKKVLRDILIDLGNPHSRSCDAGCQRLFHMRIFPDSSGCPSEFQQVSEDILRKCGGVPLAIITIASALASGQQVKPKHQWDILLQSLGCGLTKDNSLVEMRRILSFSYYNLPSHLKTCLLYLCIYPEDSTIDRDRLIWKWVAEGFVHHGDQETSLFLVGLNYFNQLINRSMIQPIYDGIGHVYACRVHDMVLDLICNLSQEAKFVNVLDGIGDNMSFQGNVRRLSLQNRNKDHQGTPLRISWVYHKFEVLRVLDLSDCNLGESSSLQLNLKGVGHLIHLRYLGLARTGIKELSAEIGNLQFLEVLDLESNYELDELPSTLIKLRRLIYLNFVSIRWFHLLSLCNLRQIEILCINRNSEETSYELMDILGERWVPPAHLHKFEYWMPSQLSALRGWIKRDPSHLSNVTELFLKSVKEVQQEDMEIIGVIRADGFRCMVVFHLDCVSAAQIIFEPGSLPRAEEVWFSLGVRVAKEDGNCGFDLGLQGNLLSLRRLTAEKRIARCAGSRDAGLLLVSLKN
nr:NBS-LRR disease resistance protein [Dasypyrum villosum]